MLAVPVTPPALGQQPAYARRTAPAALWQRTAPGRCACQAAGVGVLRLYDRWRAVRRRWRCRWRAHIPGRVRRGVGQRRHGRRARACVGCCRGTKRASRKPHDDRGAQGRVLKGRHVCAGADRGGAGGSDGCNVARGTFGVAAHGSRQRECHVGAARHGGARATARDAAADPVADGAAHVDGADSQAHAGGPRSVGDGACSARPAAE
mmetsp:Transcript_39697/g.118121  ORF Transcript_39697/g.118121 Transcript_39697/m.118121 type:complete len:207 (-) Transcript_39697:738-1358(-)